MRRKIIKQGNNSYTLTIPIHWIKEHNLDGSQDVEVNEEDGKLMVAVPSEMKRPEVSLNVDISKYNERTIKVVVFQAYRKGFDKMIVTYGEMKQLEVVRSLVTNSLLGFEIVSEEQNKCVIQNIAEPSSEKFDIILRKEMLLLKEESQEILQHLEKNKYDIRRREDMKVMFDKLNNFTRRVIVRDKIGGTKNSYFLFYFTSKLSLLYHAYFYFYKAYAQEKMKNVDKDIKELLIKVNENYGLLYDAFYKKNLDIAHQVKTGSEEAIKRVFELIGEKKGMQNKLLIHIANIARVTAMASTILFGIYFAGEDSSK